MVLCCLFLSVRGLNKPSTWQPGTILLCNRNTFFEKHLRLERDFILPTRKMFFLPHHFYFSLKKSIISEEDYKAVKKIYRTQELGNLGQLSKLYNFRDTSWLRYSCGELSTSKNAFKFNPRKCNSTSSFSGCVYRDKSKCLIPHHTRAEDAFLFERTRIGGLSCVNSHLPFDSQIVLPKNKKDKYKLI